MDIIGRGYMFFQFTSSQSRFVQNIHIDIEFYNICIHKNLTKIHQTDKINSNLNAIQFS